ncbi:BTAD domain-containing putative transcriptional regulator [Kitasatospora sp. NPDC049258]|uniref:AfsR/SARP family transcriptional regulator n=1 Tax=Kitasatospora sp. NPDC049258 TaxID=3155394 RepID=UPI0034350E88
MEFCVLGSLLVRDGSGEHVVPAAKQRVLLAALLLRPGQVVPADVLADTIWNFSPPPSAATTLRNYVMRLRRSLGAAGERIGTREGGYLIELDPSELDAWRFESLRAQGVAALREGAYERAAELLGSALGLWRGPALIDVPSDALHQFEADRLNEGRLDAVEAWMEAELRLGRHQAVVAELRALTAEHPGRERFWAQLMTALHRSGRRTEALNAYQQVRRTLVEEIGVEPGAEIREVHRIILREEESATAVGTNGVDRMVVEPLAVPFQLPADIAEFTGRAVELRRISGFLVPRRNCPPVVAVSGQPGIGKSALVVRAAYEARAEFPDGVLYAELGGTGPEPAAPGEVLEAFLLALGVAAAAIPPGLGARAALYRSVLSGRRLLVVLDDALDSAQIRPLLPADPAAATLVTGRRLLADLPGARQVGLTLPEEAEARRLFERIVGPERAAAEPAAVAELVAACGRLPLAVRAASARLVARPSWSVRDLADRLADGSRLFDELRIGGIDVRAALAASQALLSPAAARAFRLLAWSDRPEVGLGIAAAVLAQSPERTEELLEQLVDAHLLTAPAPGRFGYDHLVRAFAREQSLRHGPVRPHGLATGCAVTVAERPAGAPKVPAQRQRDVWCPSCSPSDVRAA